MAAEEAAYNVIRKDGAIEIRAYEPQLLAEVLVEGALEDASSQAFRTLFRYIDGNNTSQQKVAMTAPVSQEKASEKIAMTAPVSQEKAGEKWRVGFMMPAGLTMKTVPKPNNPAITIREKPAHRMATIRYSGRWSKERYLKHRQKLETWLNEQEMPAIGEPVWARYNAPFVPWFMRRNEILIPVESSTPSSLRGRANGLFAPACAENPSALADAG